MRMRLYTLIKEYAKPLAIVLALVAVVLVSFDEVELVISSPKLLIMFQAQ